MRGQQSWPRRVVLVHRYFAPDTPPYATILREIALELGEAGFEVCVLTCQPSYNRAIVCRAPARELISPRVRVRRFPVLPDRTSHLAKLANLVLFGCRLAVELTTMRRVDSVMVASTPPVMIALVVSVVARMRGIRLVYHMQDIYPEVAATQGGLPRILVPALRAVDAGTNRRADAVVVLSTDMETAVRERARRLRRIEVINNFDPWTLPNGSAAPGGAAVPERGREGSVRRQGLRVVFAGNVGRFQNIPRIAEAFVALDADPRITLDVIGDGPLKSWWERFAQERSQRHIRFHGYLAPDRLAAMLRRDFDLGIVSLHPGVIRHAYPSKTLSYLRAGLPVLAIVESDSELSRMLGDYAAGWVADPARRGCLEEALRAALDDADSLPERRLHARRMYESEFGRARQLEHWRALFEDLTNSPDAVADRAGAPT